MSTPTVTLNLDLRQTSQLKSGEYPLKLHLYLNGQRFRLRTKLKATEAVFEKARNGKHDAAAKQLREAMEEEVERAKTILRTASTIDKFKKAYLSGAGKTRTETGLNLNALYQQKIENFRSRNQFSYVTSFECALANMKRFAIAVLKLKPENILLTHFTPDIIREYEEWNMEKGKVVKYRDRVEVGGNSISTVRSYLRTLRVVFCDVIAEGKLPQTSYPFGRHKYSIGTNTAAKRALSEQEKFMLYMYAEPFGQRAKDMWFISYLCNGANAIDMLHLKRSNVKGDFIMFTRRKTMFSRSDNKQITVAYTPELRQLIAKYTHPNNPYLLNVLREGMTPEQMNDAKNTWKRNVNRDLKMIGERLGFARPLNIGSARHTYGSTMKMAGVETSFIRDAMGHSSEMVTDVYLNSIAGEHITSMSRHLQTFHKKPLKKVKKLIDKHFMQSTDQPEIPQHHITRQLRKNAV